MNEQQNTSEVLPRNHRLLIYVIGCPGSGKGTLCRLLVQDYGCCHISVGDLLRNLQNEQSELGLNVKDHVQEGTLVPTVTIVNILKHAITKEQGKNHAIIIDGFPRRLDQGIYSEDKVGKPDIVLFFDCEKSIAGDRYLGRKLEGRLDTEEIFHRRHDEFELLNPAILKYYQDLGFLVTIDTNKETMISYQRLVSALGWDEKSCDGSY
ncbi:adenylate kinase-domain-containing protein [Tricladium varicosporioides]|nr:adenylate kinase-domain-containing protein [Hymenoscyphus varicosporioides]